MTNRQIAGSFAALAASLALVSAATAGGEAKNEQPFTRQAAQQRIVDPSPIPEAKNELPFTRRLGRSANDGWYSFTHDWSDVFSRYVVSHGGRPS